MTLKEEMLSINWRHSIELPGLGLTPGSEPNYQARDRYLLPCIPEDLSGKDVLDIGAWDGRFSFLAEQRGAARVVALDSYDVPGASTAGPSGKGICLAKTALGSKVEIECGDVMDLWWDDIGKFDVVLFLGVLYHLQEPYRALRIIADYVLNPGGLLILETHVDLVGIARPVMAFYPGNEAGNDPTNWCGPNPACVEAMLQATGFEEIKFHGGTGMWPEPIERIQYARGAWTARRPM